MHIHLYHYKQVTYVTMHVNVLFCLPCLSIYTPFNEDNASGGGQTFLFALLNAIIVLAIVVVMTVVLVCLFYHRCYRVRLGVGGEYVL